MNAREGHPVSRASTITRLRAKRALFGAYPTPIYRDPGRVSSVDRNAS